MSEVLVLNFGFEIHNKVPLKKAIKLLNKQKAEVIESSDQRFLASAGNLYPYPEVIRLLNNVKFNKKTVAYTRKRVFIRDENMCQYCGAKGSKMTIDHVHPQSKGGRSTWDNCLTACLKCNKAKADMTYEQWVKKSGKPYRKKPYQPEFHQFLKYSSKRHRENAPVKWGRWFFDDEDVQSA